MTKSADYSWADITQLSWGTATKVTNHDWADRLQVADRFVISWHMATEPALDNWTDRLQLICKAWNGQYPTHVSICLFSGHLSVIACSHVWRFWKMSWDHCCHGWPISRAISFLNISKVSGYVLKKQTSNSYRLTLVEELPLMHEVIRAVTPPALKEKAQFLSSTVANDASLCCASATHHDASDEKLCTSLKRISLSDE